MMPVTKFYLLIWQDTSSSLSTEVGRMKIEALGIFPSRHILVRNFSNRQKSVYLGKKKGFIETKMRSLRV
jgi:hypothetical protein